MFSAKNPKSLKAKPSNASDEAKGLEKQNTKASISQDDWNIGDFCRAIFSEDGREYEAVIEKLNVSDNSAVVRYLGKNKQIPMVLPLRAPL